MAIQYVLIIELFFANETYISIFRKIIQEIKAVLMFL